MGLDITAYKNAEPFEVPEDKKDDEEYIDALYDRDGLFSIYEAGFPDQLDGRPIGFYIGEEIKHDKSSKWGGFGAGSYSGYNGFRDRLSHMALGLSAAQVWNHAAEMQDRPFVQMINFSDCEGAIGPETSAKLAKDFADCQFMADAEMDEYDQRVYRNFREAFEAVAGNGFVVWHCTCDHCEYEVHSPVMLYGLPTGWAHHPADGKLELWCTFCVRHEREEEEKKRKPTAEEKRIRRLERSLQEVAIPSLRYCEEKYGYDDQARLNLEAVL